MGAVKLTENEQELLVLCIVDGCLKFAKQQSKTFEEVLNEDVFPSEASIGYSEMVCKTIKALKDKGYINGTVELAYEIEMDADTFEEETTDAIDFVMCTFEDIEISMKGKARMSAEGFKEVSKDFMEKAKPVIKCIATTMLQTCVESSIILGLRSVGVPV